MSRMDKYIKETREFDWKLHHFTRNLAMSELKDILSDEFYILLDKRDTKWCFSIQVKGSFLGVFLIMKDSKVDDYTIMFDVFVRKLNGEKIKSDHFTRASHEFQVGQEYGWANFMSVDEICDNADQYLKDDNILTLGLKVFLVKKKKMWKIDAKKCKTHCQYLAMSKKYFETKLLSDFTIICSDGTEIPVHRLILANFSPVLDAMFRSDMIETNNSVVKIEDIDGETMTEILRFIYTQDVKNLMELAPKILYGAEKYELDKLKKICAGSMIENLCLGNAVEYFLLADKYDIQDLFKRCINFIRHNFRAFRRNQDWEQLDRKHLIMLLDCFENSPKHVRIFETML